MDTTELLRIRLRRQLIDAPGDAPRSPAEVVRALGALQAQDYPGALWAIGLRCGAGTTVADVERAIEARTIVRTWPMRGTLHFVSPCDVRWMIGLLGPRMVAKFAGRRRQLGLDAETFAHSREVLTEALSGGRALTRPEIMALLAENGVDPADQRGYHVLVQLAIEGVLVIGPMRGRQQTFVLLDEWVPDSAHGKGAGGGPAPAGNAEGQDAREGALARLAARYVSGHAPATAADFAWWAGLTKREAQAGLASAQAAGAAASVKVDGREFWLAAGAGVGAGVGAGAIECARRPEPAPAAPARRPSPDVHLLPAFDEYLLGYTDRASQLGEHREAFGRQIGANGIISPTVIADGLIVATWKRSLKRDRVEIAVSPFRRLSSAERDGLCSAAERYGAFLGLPSQVTLGG